MIKIIYILLFTTAAVFLETALRTFGVILPLAAPFVFYCAVAFGPYYGAVTALLCGCGLDFLSGHTHPVTAVTLGFVVVFAMFWLHKVESESVSLHIVPGALLPLIAWLPAAFFVSGTSFDQILSHASDLVIACILSAFILPVGIVVLDALNKRLEIELYSNAKIRIRHFK